VKLEITHITRYYYQGFATDNVNEIRLTPRTNYRQSCYHHTIKVEPKTALMQYEDYFGNKVYSFSIARPHPQLMIKMHSIVVTQDAEPQSCSTLPLTEELAILGGPKFQNRYAEYLVHTPYVQFSPALREYAGDIADFTRSGSVYDTVRTIARSIHTDFTYCPGATNVLTTADETLQLKQGVCQDFSHLMLAVCRIKGIPARYVSGYHFVTDLSGGPANFEQASHAWVEAHIPGVGWLGFDPTNNGTMTWRYVKLGHGRDYRDIVPIKGIFSGSEQQRMEVKVDVHKVESEVDSRQFSR
jgi:transglutaminase-like putative cysteine protease